MSMPRLTETLPGPVAPNRCQSCSAPHTARAPLQRFQECDEHDEGEYRVLVLCRRCSELFVEKHPRLYRQLEDAMPWPGCMSVCVACRHREGVTCTSTAAQVNGGPGLTYEPMPQRIHACRARRAGGSGWIWWGPRVERCSGFEPQPSETEPCATA